MLVAPEVDHACRHGDDERPDRRPAPLEATRRAHADQRSHEQAHVEGARVDEQSFEDVGVPAQMRPPHAPGLVEMGVGAFEAFATLARIRLRAAVRRQSWRKRVGTPAA